MSCKSLNRVLIILLTGLSGYLPAQTNLVLNPSFEIEYGYCSGQTWSINQGSILPWRNGLGNNCNVIYRNSCNAWYVDPPDTLYDLPWTAGPGYQYARTGNAITGLANYQHADGIYAAMSEYLRGKLSHPLVHGKHYYCGLYVNYPNFESLTCSNFGMYLAPDTLPQYYNMPAFDGAGNIQKRLIPRVPQVNNPVGRSLYDTLNWLLIADTVVATGNEQYLFIGMFDDGNPLDTAHNGFYGTTYLNSPFPYRPQSGYNIDDVFVIDLDTITGIKQEDVTAYYNQTQNEINITLPTPHALQSIQLFNSSGQLVYDTVYNPPSGKSRVPLPPLPNGIYVTELTTVLGYKVHKKVVISIE